MNKFRTEFYIYLLFCLIGISLWFPGMFQDKGYFFDNFGTLNYPFENFKYQMFQSKEFFFWNPYIFAGMPYQADLSKGCFYPGSLFFYLLPTAKAIPWYLWFHFSLAGIFMYLWLRNLGIDRKFSLFGGITFMLCGFFTIHSLDIIFIATGCWLPLLLMLLDKFFSTGKKSFAFWVIIVGSLQLLSGAVVILFYSWIVVFAFTFYRFFTTKTSFKVKFIRYILSFLGIVTAIVLLTSIQLLPFLELSKVTIRNMQGDWLFSIAHALPPQSLITLLVPDAFGNPMKGEGKYWGAGEVYWEVCIYIGIIPLILVLFSKAKSSIEKFLGYVAICALLLSMGSYTPLHKLFYYIFPIYRTMRCPGRWSFVWSFAMATLVGLKGRAFLQDLPYSQLKAFTAFGIISIVISLYFLLLTNLEMVVYTGILIFLALIIASLVILWGRKVNLLSSETTIIFLLALTVLDLWYFGFSFNKPIPVSKYYDRIKFLSFSPQEKEPFRVITNTAAGILTEYYDGGIIYKLANIQGYEPLAIKDYLNYLNYNETGKLLSQSSTLRLLNRSNAFYIKNLYTNLIKLLRAKYYIKEFSRNQFNLTLRLIWQPLADFPYCFLVYDYKVVKNFNEALNTLYKAKISELLNSAVLTEKPDFTLPYHPSHYNVSVDKYTPDEIILNTSSSKPALLVVSEIYYPAWKVEVDSKRSKIYKVNGIFRGVYLPAGNHRVKFYYSSDYYFWGKMISLTSLIIMCMSFLIDFLIRKKAQS